MSNKRRRRDKVPESPSNLLLLVRAFVGPAFVIGGWQLMQASYIAGLGIVYFGFFLCLAECIWEPALIRRPYQLQVALVCMLSVLFAAFTIQVAVIFAPIRLFAFAMRNGNYADGTNIAGIAWNSHFTPLRVVITNPDHDDYKEVDIAIKADNWIHQAAIEGDNPENCTLSVSPHGTTLFTTITKGGGRRMTAHNFGGTMEVENDVGDVFSPLATSAGYRVRCRVFPKQSAVRVLLAAINLNAAIVNRVPRQYLAPGQWGLSVAEFSNKSEVDVFGDKPSPQVVSLIGEYRKQTREFSINETIKVENGN